MTGSPKTDEGLAGVGTDTIHPCLWMSAGLISYKLCDRSFDCEHCPLDAALRGETLLPRSSVPPSPEGRVAALCFPDDRLYDTGHTWVREAAGTGLDGFEVGLDAFAAALLREVKALRPVFDGGPVCRGAPLCEVELDGGSLVVASPVSGIVESWNTELDEDPELALRAPYGDGWLALLAPTGFGSLEEMIDAEGARERTRLDLRRFRRRAAIFLFSEADLVGPTLADGGEVLTDLRYILGARRYLDLVGDLVG